MDSRTFIAIELSHEDKEELKRLIKIGLPLVLLGFMFTNLTNIDRIVVIKMLGLEQMGLYSVALMMGNLVYNISNMGGIVLYPRFQEIYGKTGERENVFKVMTTVLKVISVPLLIFTALAVFLLPYAVKMIIPKYVDGIPAMRIFLWGTYFLSMSIFCGHYLVTLDKQKYSLVAGIITIIFWLLYFFAYFEYNNVIANKLPNDNQLQKCLRLVSLKTKLTRWFPLSNPTFILPSSCNTSCFLPSTKTCQPG